MDPKRGDMVEYVMQFDSDTSYSPNQGPAIVTKVNEDGSIDLHVFAINGSFSKWDVKKGEPEERGSWHLIVPLVL